MLRRFGELKVDFDNASKHDLGSLRPAYTWNKKFAESEATGRTQLAVRPSEWVEDEVLQFPGEVDGPWRHYVQELDERGNGTVFYRRLVPRDEEAADRLSRRTLTNLYNDRPAWLDDIHRQLDETVFAAYGWSSDIADEEILERLLTLNLEQAGES